MKFRAFSALQKILVMNCSLWWLSVLLLVSGDVELNPGPPRRAPRDAARKDDGPKESKENASNDLGSLGTRVRQYEEKVERLEKLSNQQRQEIEELKQRLNTMDEMKERLRSMSGRMDGITSVYDELHEKLHALDTSRQNNLLFYGLKPDFLPEISSQLEQKINEIIKHTLGIHREVYISRVSRLITGPEVRGCRPVLVSFVNYRDREEVLRKSNFLKSANVYVSEDLSRKVREHRHELHKFAKSLKQRRPQAKCVVRGDKLFVDNHMFVFDEDRNEVVKFNRPQSPPRAPSTDNYSSVDASALRRATSVHSVDGEARNNAERASHSASNMSHDNKMYYGSNDSLHKINAKPRHKEHQFEGSSSGGSATVKFEEIREEEESDARIANHDNNEHNENAPNQ